MRARVVNPKWIEAMKRHGYRGAFEIIATLDFMFGFAATTARSRRIISTSPSRRSSWTRRRGISSTANRG